LVAPNGGVGYGSDVYELGLLLYEMLAGRPAFQFDQRKDNEVRQSVAKGLTEPLNRTDLAEDIHNIVHLATSRSLEQRQQDVRVFAKLLRTKFGEVPAEKKRSFNRPLIAIATIVALATIIMILISALIA
jgi:serine/threonine protein kinase